MLYSIITLLVIILIIYKVFEPHIDIIGGGNTRVILWYNKFNGKRTFINIIGGQDY